MTTWRALLFSTALIVSTSPAFGQGSVCTGQFPNLITDVCYDCMFPFRIGGGLISFGVSGDDYDTGVNSPVCLCAQNLTVGTPSGFWEPRFMVDTTNKPGCMPLLGGVDVQPAYNSLQYGADKTTNAQLNGSSKSAFMHANEYINPIMTALGIVASTQCMDSRSFDVPFLSWADPTWGDDSLSLVLTPYAYPFAGLLQIAAEVPDAIAATIGFPIPELFWVQGSWGATYPLTGNVSTPKSPEQVAHLLVARLLAKLHAAGTQQSTAGPAALESCGALGVPQLIMDKRQYKTNRLFPYPDNLCTPFGRPLQFQEIGTSRPQDKDYGYMIFQRKDCCAPVASP